MLKRIPGRHRLLVEIFSPDKNECPFCVAGVLVQEVVQLTTLHPNSHCVLCLDGIAGIYFLPRLDASIP